VEEDGDKNGGRGGGEGEEDEVFFLHDF